MGNISNGIELRYMKRLIYGKLIDIDSYMLENGEDIKMKYNLHIGDLDDNVVSYTHQGGKPEQYVYNMIDNKVFFIVNYLNEVIEITSDKNSLNVDDILPFEKIHGGTYIFSLCLPLILLFDYIALTNIDTSTEMLTLHFVMTLLNFFALQFLIKNKIDDDRDVMAKRKNYEEFMKDNGGVIKKLSTSLTYKSKSLTTRSSGFFKSSGGYSKGG
ncbi:hypothetical protein GQ105_003383 [Salmonella enterica]|nr:hypothetical protein [Salmonella enterica]